MAWAVSLFCTLAVSETIRHTSGELLWPAIHKGLSQSAGVILSKGHHPKADFVARALLLLENGCKLRQLSGLGNGDLVVNPKTQQIMPPPPNIEQMLQNAIDFVQWHVRMLLSTECHKQDNPEESQKGKRFTGSYALLISQLKILHQSYPSSQAVSTVMNELLQKSTRDLKELLAGKDASTSEGDVKKLLLVSLIYGACSCGAEPEKKSYTSLIRLLMSTGLSTAGDGQPGVWVKSSRSIIQYARWATILCLLPKLLDVTSDSASDRTQDEMDRLIDDLLKEGVRASSMTPSDAIKPLFDCIVMSSREWMGSSSKYYSTQMDTLCVTNLTKIVQSLLSLIKQSVRSRESAIMLNGFCALVFQPKLLREEFDRITKDPKCKTPIRDGFRQLIKMAGRYRQQITRAVLCRITVGWLDEEGSDSRGLSAIPYREDIVKLLIFKEGKYDESSSNQSLEELPTTGVTEIPSNTNYHSVTRTFLLVFFGQLPNPQAGLNTTVKKELLHYVILELLKHASPEKTTHPSLVMRGTPTYCIKIRAWQALCILSRFVTQEIASNVCATVYGAMNELLHNQIRFFLENFTIKCATMHEMIFGEAFLKDICRTDLSLQHISSLMIMGGNFIVGRYQLGYFTKDDTDKSRSKRVLAGVVPWLSSTQGFSRAIAQLIVYKLIPRVVSIHSDNTNPTTTSIPENDWFLKSTYNFLEQNREMNRLRNKQTKFFERYDCDAMCTPEGIFSIKIDEAEEADPLHLIDVMKEALRSTYDEAHAADAPSWKHVEERMIDAVEDDEEDRDESNNITSTVQRKIIPLDSLNLALEDLREQRLSNARGAHKQNLIVCASLVDKVPNLAGLARTCEIFAAQSLVIPDLSVSKMDNFQSISVGAVDWIDMEEVKEEVRETATMESSFKSLWTVNQMKQHLLTINPDPQEVRIVALLFP
jgi:tRNA G18 (ribose-2'-O)-methylase SpoU